MSVVKTYTALINKTNDVDVLIDLLSSYKNKIQWCRNAIKHNNADIEDLQKENERLKKEYFPEMDTLSIEYLIKEKIAKLTIEKRKE